jgi:hypothetical protein
MRNDERVGPCALPSILRDAPLPVPRVPAGAHGLREAFQNIQSGETVRCTPALDRQRILGDPGHAGVILTAVPNDGQACDRIACWGWEHFGRVGPARRPVDRYRSREESGSTPVLSQAGGWGNEHAQPSGRRRHFVDLAHSTVRVPRRTPDAVDVCRARQPAHSCGFAVRLAQPTRS